MSRIAALLQVPFHVPTDVPNETTLPPPAPQSPQVTRRSHQNPKIARTPTEQTLLGNHASAGMNVRPPTTHRLRFGAHGTTGVSVPGEKVVLATNRTALGKTLVPKKLGGPVPCNCNADGVQGRCQRASLYVCRRGRGRGGWGWWSLSG